MAKHNPNGRAEKGILRRVLDDQTAAKRNDRDADRRLKALDRGSHGKQKGSK